MKHLITFLFIIGIIFLFSCSSNDKVSKKDTKRSNNSEIGYSELEGGETLHLYGKTEDAELSRKMKLLDIDFIECYQDVMQTGKAENIDLDFTIFIDYDGYFEEISLETPSSKNALKISRCVEEEIGTLSVRPGNSREVNFKLSYKIIQEKSKKEIKKQKLNDLRSKTISSLAQNKKFRECYESQRANNPNLTGKFSLKFTVSYDGEVYDIELINNTFPDKIVINCIIEKLEDTIFPKGDSDDEVEVNFEYGSTHDNPRTNKPRRSLSL